MIEENQDFNLETDHLEEVIETPPPAQPVVVIQYRTRGVPWYLVVPALVLVPLGAVAFYHRVSARSQRLFVPPPAVDQAPRKAAEGPPPAPKVDLGAPLALNSQPIAPGSLPAVMPAPLPAPSPTLAVAD